MVKISFECKEKVLRDLRKLTKILGLKDLNQTIQFAAGQAVELYLKPGEKGQIMVVDTHRLYETLKNLHNRIRQLDPKVQAMARAKKNREIGKRIYNLYGQGKKKEADKLRNENPGAFYTYWPEEEKKQ